MKNYRKMYERALKATGGQYKGYTGANALSLYVDEKYRVNAADNTFAHDALCDVVSRMDNEQIDD